MKNFLILFIILLFVYACEDPVMPNNNDDDGDTTEKTLLKADYTFQTTGNTGTLLVENGDRFISMTQPNTISNYQQTFSYDANNKMKDYKSFADSQTLDKSFTFSYSGNSISSVHDFDSNPFFTYEPQHQDRTVTWSNNIMRLPLLVDNVQMDFDQYDFTFNTEGLLTKYKITDYSGEVNIDVSITYDDNQNPIHLGGFYVFWDETPIDISITYDNKKNPFYPFYHTYYKENVINAGARKGDVFDLYPLLSGIYKFAKNNATKITSVESGTSVVQNFTHTYSGNYPTKTKIYQNSALLTTINYTYSD